MAEAGPPASAKASSSRDLAAELPSQDLSSAPVHGDPAKTEGWLEQKIGHGGREDFPHQLSETGQRELGQMAQLIDTAARFDAVLAQLEAPAPLAERLAEFEHFLESRAITDRPYFDRQPRQDAITLATASWFAQSGRAVAIQFWLDAHSASWRKSDARELTNPRALRHDRPPGPYTLSEDERDQDAKLGQTLLACCSRATRQIRVYSSHLDATGRDQASALAEHLTALQEGLSTPVAGDPQ